MANHQRIINSQCRVVAADVRRRTIRGLRKNPPPHVGGYNFWHCSFLLASALHYSEPRSIFLRLDVVPGAPDRAGEKRVAIGFSNARQRSHKRLPPKMRVPARAVVELSLGSGGLGGFAFEQHRQSFESPKPDRIFPRQQSIGRKIPSSLRK